MSETKAQYAAAITSVDLSKRELISALMMQGLIIAGRHPYVPLTATMAVQATDNLLAALEEPCETT